MIDLQRLIEKYEKRTTELEAQLGAMRHKHDVLVEASRLLEDETPIPHKNLYQRILDADRERKKFKST